MGHTQTDYPVLILALTISCFLVRWSCCLVAWGFCVCFHSMTATVVLAVTWRCFGVVCSSVDVDLQYMMLHTLADIQTSMSNEHTFHHVRNFTRVCCVQRGTKKSRLVYAYTYLLWCCCSRIQFRRGSTKTPYDCYRERGRLRTNVDAFGAESMLIFSLWMFLRSASTCCHLAEEVQGQWVCEKGRLIGESCTRNTCKLNTFKCFMCGMVEIDLISTFSRGRGRHCCIHVSVWRVAMLEWGPTLHTHKNTSLWFTEKLVVPLYR